MQGTTGRNGESSNAGEKKGVDKAGSGAREERHSEWFNLKQETNAVDVCMQILIRLKLGQISPS